MLGASGLKELKQLQAKKRELVEQSTRAVLQFVADEDLKDDKDKKRPEAS